MRYIQTIIRVSLFCVVLLLLGSCSKKGIIGKRDMVSIVHDMYLADQYIEMNPEMRAMTDTLSVYPAIFEKYGYTAEEYSNSLRYYLQKSDVYTKILTAASNRLETRMKELEEEVERQRRSIIQMERWWALDSLKRIQSRDLVYDPLLRTVRWLVLPDKDFEVWTVLDSAIVDIPSNPQWWANNMGAASRSFVSFYVAPEKKPKKVNKMPVLEFKLPPINKEPELEEDLEEPELK